jgi:hypothetical protein
MIPSFIYYISYILAGFTSYNISNCIVDSCIEDDTNRRKNIRRGKMTLIEQTEKAENRYGHRFEKSKTWPLYQSLKFSPTVKCILIPSCKDMSETIKKSLWYQLDDYIRFETAFLEEL